MTTFKFTCPTPPTHPSFTYQKRVQITVEAESAHQAWQILMGWRSEPKRYAFPAAGGSGVAIGEIPWDTWSLVLATTTQSMSEKPPPLLERTFEVTTTLTHQVKATSGAEAIAKVKEVFEAQGDVTYAYKTR